MRYRGWMFEWSMARVDIGVTWKTFYSHKLCVFPAKLKLA